MRKLYEYEADYYEAMERAIDWAEMGCTLEDAIEDIGFNNITLMNPYEEDTDRKDIHNLYHGSSMVDKLTKEMLKAKVVLSSTYQDGDDFTCANMVLENKEDWKLFEKLVEEA